MPSPRSQVSRLCQQCGTSFLPLDTPRIQMCCSRKCSNMLRTVRHPRPCAHCGLDYMPHRGQNRKTPQRFCSARCATSSRGRSTPKETLLRYIQINGDCWLWTGHRSRDGYGKIQVFIGDNRRTFLAHRLSWIIHIGSIPDGLEVCHNCPTGDNPACVNPAHLFLGTHHQNCQDASRKQRFPKRRPWLDGTDNPASILTTEAVIDIRRRYRIGGITQQQLADEYHVSRPTISIILSRRTWKHLDDDSAG